MIHQRERLATKTLLKRLQYFPVVAIQGARQVGKSYLASEMIEKKVKDSKYITLDVMASRNQAQERPQTFISQFEEFKTLIIDEAQKAPPLFDTIKSIVDKNRKSGQFLLLGSTEFSHLINIRESLTGRMGRIRMLPMTLFETLKMKKVIPRKSELLRYLNSGGFPRVFSIRDSGIQTQLILDWLSLICERDIFQFKKLQLSSDLAFSIIEKSCILEEPTQANFARSLRVSTRKVESHLKALCALFVLNKIDPHPSGTGKSIFLPLDTSIVEYFRGSLLRKLHVWRFNERMAYREYSKENRTRFYYYRSTGKRMIHLVEDRIPGLAGYEIQESEIIRETDSFLMSAFLNKNKNSKGLILSPIDAMLRINNIEFHPWESAAVIRF